MFGKKDENVTYYLHDEVQKKAEEERAKYLKKCINDKKGNEDLNFALNSQKVSLDNLFGDPFSNSSSKDNATNQYHEKSQKFDFFSSKKDFNNISRDETFFIDTKEAREAAKKKFEEEMEKKNNIGKTFEEECKNKLSKSSLVKSYQDILKEEGLDDKKLQFKNSFESNQFVNKKFDEWKMQGKEITGSIPLVNTPNVNTVVKEKNNTQLSIDSLFDPNFIQVLRNLIKEELQKELAELIQ